MSVEINTFSDQEIPLKQKRPASIQKEHSPFPPKVQVKRCIEALLFSTHEPLPLQRIREITDGIQELKPKILKELLEELRNEYDTQQRGFQLDEVAEGYLLRTRSEFHPYVGILHQSTRGDRLSHAAIEALAIIAYRQPVTRTFVDSIRGVDSSGTIYNLLERNLIEAVGKLEAPGRPTLYGITKYFLEYFGINSLDELPKHIPPPT